MSRLVGKPTMWFPNRSDTNRAVQAQKTARSMKFRIKEVEGLYYPCSENKGADQLRGDREADLRLCFRICRLLVFPWGGSDIMTSPMLCRSPIKWRHPDMTISLGCKATNKTPKSMEAKEVCSKYM